MKTKIILQQDVPNLGMIGETREVSPGYARNYLLPRKMAVPATPRQKRLWAERKEQLEKDQKDKLAAAQKQGKSLQEVTVNLVARAGKDGKLFGSITSSDVARALNDKGVVVDKRWVDLRDPIRTTGDFIGMVRLHPQVRASFKIVVQALA